MLGQHTLVGRGGIVKTKLDTSWPGGKRAEKEQAAPTNPLRARSLWPRPQRVGFFKVSPSPNNPRLG